MNHATELISCAFDDRDVHYRVMEIDTVSMIEAGFSIDAGPDVIVRFISTGENNDVGIRVYGLIHNIPVEKKAVMLETCNRLNETIRFVKFYLDKESNINVEADLPVEIGDESLGACCFELLVRIVRILNDKYHILAEALYQGNTDNQHNHKKLMQFLEKMQEKPIAVNGEPS